MKRLLTLIIALMLVAPAAWAGLYEDAMAAIERHVFSDPWPASSFASLMEQSHARMFVAVDAAMTLVGYCVLLHVLDEGEIANIAVTPAYQRRGIASQLLDHAIGEAVAMALRFLYLEVRVGNVAARALYGSRRFAAVGRRRGYYRDPLEDALVLQWINPVDVAEKSQG